MLMAVRTVTTLPLVLNFFRCNPSSPTSEKNCLFPVLRQSLSEAMVRWRFGPCCRRNRLVNRTPAPYTANRAPME